MDLKTLHSSLKERMEKLRKRPDPYKVLFQPLHHWKIIVATSVVMMILSVSFAGAAFFLYGNPTLSVTTDPPRPLLDEDDLEEVLSVYLTKEREFQQLQNDPPEFIEP